MSLRHAAFATLSLSLCLLTHNSHAQFDPSFYHARYGLQTVDQKLVNNRGEGFEALYGVRNFREVLKGVLFRGGANNAFHRENPRDNSNPLPNDGLANLCQEGFKKSVYLYSTNFRSAPPQVNCNSIRGVNRLEYQQLSFSAKSREILGLVRAAINDPSQGPLYLHCWNGWHASGMIAAYALKQFCGWTGDAAVAYWVRNADGTDNGGFESIKRRIREFQPFPELSIDPAAQAMVCPN